MRMTRRAQNFEQDYTAFLLSLASAVRAGLDPLQFMCRAPDLFAERSVLREELRAFREAIERGESEEAAITGFAATVSHPDIDLFRGCLLLARREGSSLGECLQRLTRVTRQRQSFRRKMRAALAMQKLSALGIAGCACLIAAVQSIAAREAFLEALSHPLGIRVLSAGIVLIVAGVSWMLALARVKV